MDRATFKLIAAIGLLLYGALYLAAVTLAALHLSRPGAWRVAIVTLGVTYLSYLCHFVGDHDRRDRLANAGGVLSWLSIILGIVAGMLLVF